jgi:hypothetical protein
MVSTLLLLLALASAAVAEGIRGTATNGSTGKPAAGVTVTLVDPMGGMAEIATVKADAQGRFRFNTPAAQGPRLVRAEKGGVNYFKMLTPGVTTIDVTVYDAAAAVEGISGAADVVRMQSDGSTLQATELFAIKNESKPPRTLASAKTFEFVLPEGAEIDGADAQAPNGQPIAAKAIAAKEKNHYAFSFAIKPGETRFQIAYHLSYGGKASFSPRLTRDFEHYVLVLPASMTFTPRDAKQFEAMTNQPGSNVQVSRRARAGEDINYAIAGTGMIPDEEAGAQGGASARASAGAPAGASAGTPSDDNRPGGGLGKPIDAPDGLAKYRWYILTLLMLVLIGGGIWTRERTLREKAEEGRGSTLFESTDLPRAAEVGGGQGSLGEGTGASVSRPAPGNLLLGALKEELFQLETEHQQGKLTAEEYGKARAALEQTLQRALARNRS